MQEALVGETMAHFLITGHTGFKGYWLSALLQSRGHSVAGVSLKGLPNSLYSRSARKGDFTHDLLVDIRDKRRLNRAFDRVRPDYVFHMAAQSLVREGYREPQYTYETNVTGTWNVLDAVHESATVRAAVIVTSDKVYLNNGSRSPFTESDSLGGSDPYSASKAMADIAAQEYSSRPASKPIGIARAGNVIGAGDVTRDRLFPDLVRSFIENDQIVLRYPAAVRPWQHVLDCLQGYILLLDSLESVGPNGPFNFGPPPDREASVGDVVGLALSLIGRDAGMVVHESPTLHEDAVLLVDSSRARNELGWQDAFTMERAVQDALFDARDLNPAHVRTHVQSTIAEWELARRNI